MVDYLGKVADYLSDPKRFVGLVLMMVAWIGIIYTDWLKRDEIWTGLKGHNKLLDIPEYIIWMWIKLYPVIILSDLFLDYELSNNGWWSMNIIMLLALLGKAAVMKFLRLDTDKKSTTVTVEEKTTHTDGGTEQ